MDARRRRLNAAYPNQVRWARLAAVALLPVALGATSCGAFSEKDQTTSTIEVDRESREEGDVEGAVDDELEVYRLTATVTDIKRVAEYGELDNRGYIEATVSMTNPTGDSIDYDRTDWRLEKPDGTVANTATVSGQSQLQDDKIPAGETVEGKVIYSVGDLDGQFAVIFAPASLRPQDELQLERGVWVFESSPEDAE